MGKADIPYVDTGGILHQLLTFAADTELSTVGEYGLLWLSYMEENHKGRLCILARLGCANCGQRARSMRKPMKCWIQSVSGI